MKNIFLLLFFLQGIAGELYAQENNGMVRTHWLAGVSVKVAKASVIDKSFSSLSYSGTNVGGSVRLKCNSEKALHSLLLSAVAGDLKTALLEGGVAKSKLANIDYALLVKLKSTNESYINCSVGAGISVLYAERKYSHYINTNAAFEFASSISLSVLLTHEFKDHLKGFSISNNVNAPVISYLVQPPFGNVNFSSSTNKNSLNSKSIGAFSSFFRLNNCFSIDRTFNAKHKLSSGYTWDYYHFKHLRDVNSANHSLAFTYYHTI